MTKDIPGYSTASYMRHHVIDTIRIENKSYYEIDIYGSHYYREYSLGHFYEYKDGKEQLIMDFTMSVGESRKDVAGSGVLTRLNVRHISEVLRLRASAVFSQKVTLPFDLRSDYIYER